MTAAVYRTVAGGTITGYEDGPRKYAKFKKPVCTFVDQDNRLFVVDSFNDCIRLVTWNGMVSTIVGYPSEVAWDSRAGELYRPGWACLDNDGNIILPNIDAHRIVKVAPDRTVSCLAGSGNSGCEDGLCGKSRFYYPQSVAYHEKMGVVVADTGNNCIRAISGDGIVCTLAGNVTSGHADGPLKEATFSKPCAIAVDSRGRILVADYQNKCVRVIEDGFVRTLHHCPGPRGICVDGDDNIIITCTEGLLMLNPEGHEMPLPYVKCKPNDVEIQFFSGTSIDHHGNLISIANYNHRIILIWATLKPPPRPAHIPKKTHSTISDCLKRFHLISEHPFLSSLLQSAV